MSSAFDWMNWLTVIRGLEDRSFVSTCTCIFLPTASQPWTICSVLTHNWLWGRLQKTHLAHKILTTLLSCNWSWANSSLLDKQLSFLFFPCMNCITNAALQWDILKNYILLNYKYYYNYCSFIIYSFTGKPTMHKTLSFQVFILVSVPQAMSIPLSVFSRFSKKNED